MSKILSKASIGLGTLLVVILMLWGWTSGLGSANNQ